MKLSIALKEALRYNLIAVVPTLLGLGIAGVALWVGALQSVLEVLATRGPRGVVAGGVTDAPSFSPLVAVAGVAVGYLVHRVGRTTALFKIQGEAVAETLGPGAVDAVEETPADRAATPADGSDSDPVDAPSSEGSTDATDATAGLDGPSSGA